MIHLEINGQDVVLKCKNGIQDLGKALGTIPGAAGKASNALQAMSAVSVSIQGMYSGMQQVTSLMSTYISKSNAATESQVKLSTIMRQRMDASGEEISDINKLISKQTELGVVGGTVQRSGMQQLATFASEKKTLEMLLPAMNNLLVQQNGLNSTSESAVGVANLMGKALMGNVGALTRVGITLTDHQKELIKTGDEYTRAKTLAEAITQNVGEMNEELANTDAGKAKKAANEIGSLQVKLGKFFSEYQSGIMMMGQVGMAVSGFAQLANGIIGTTKALFSFTTASSVAAFNNKIATSTVRGLTTALGLSTVSITGATIAVKALTWALRALEVASVIGAVFAGLSIVMDALGISMDKTAGKADNLTDVQRRQSAQAEEMSRRDRRNSEIMGRASDDLVGRYNTLKEQYAALKTVHEKNEWIKKNQSAFSELGMSVGGINDAYDYFVKNSNNVIRALTAIADAKAWEEIYSKDRKAYLEETRKPGTVANGAYHRIYKTGEKIKVSDFRNMGLGKGDSYLEGNTLHLTEQGAKRATSWEVAQARKRQSSRFTPLRNNMNQSRAEMQKAQRNAISLSSGSGIDFNRRNSTVNTGNNGTGGASHTGGTTDEILPVGSIADLQKKISDLQKQRERLTDASDIAKVDSRIIELKDDIDALNISARQIGFGNRVKEILPDGFDSKELGSFAPDLKIPAPDSSEFKNGLSSLSDTIEEWGKDAKEKTEQTVQDINDLFSSLDGGIGSSIKQWQTLGEAFQTMGVNGQTAGTGMVMVGQSLEQIAGDGAAAKAGSIMAAIGQLVLGYATATAQAAKLGPFGWIGFAIAGAATLASIIAQVSSFSTGGIVGGTSYHGDKVPAKVNSGEMVLTMQQQKRLFDIANGMTVPKLPVVTPDTSRVDSMVEAPVISVSIDSTVQGTALKQVIRNVEKKYAKVGKKWT